MAVKDYRNHIFESSCTTTPDYRTFEKRCRFELRQQAAKYGFNVHSFHGNHFEWSAVLERNEKYVYISMPDVRFWNWYEDILVRIMSHPADWHGGPNNKATWENFAEVADRISY